VGEPDRACHAACLGDGLSQPVDDRHEPLGCLHSLRDRTTWVEPPALPGLLNDGPRTVDVVVELVGSGDPAVDVVCFEPLAQPCGDLDE
jgi:hypothetical protein